MAKVESSDDSSTKSPVTFKHTWFLYAIYFHVIVLYFMIYSLFSELQQAKLTIHEFNVNFINITSKEIQMQLKFLKDVSHQVCSENAIVKRSKRDLFSGESARFDFSHGRKSHTSSHSDDEIEHGSLQGDSERRNNSERRGLIPRASHFIGAIPEPLIRDGGLLAPWLVADEAIKDFGLVTKVPTRSRDSIEIVESGLYFIYAQVYYMGSPEKSRAHNSFLIMLKPSFGPEKPLAQCATLSDRNIGGEASCYTGVAHSLLAGDLVYVKQRERDRHIIMRPGQTFLGLILLNKKFN